MAFITCHDSSINRSARIGVVLVVLCFSNEGQEVHAAHFQPLKKLANFCRTITKRLGAHKTATREFTLDIRNFRTRKEEIAKHVASLPWLDQIGKQVRVKYVSDDMGEEIVEQTVHDSVSIAVKYPIVISVSQLVRDHSKKLAKEEFHRRRKTGEVVDESSLQPEVGQYIVLLGDEVLYTSEVFTSGHRASISNEVNEAEWQKLLDATHQRFLRPPARKPEIVFLHTHPTSYSPLSPPDIIFAERIRRFFEDHFIVSPRVTVIAAPIPNEGSVFFLASVPR